MVAPLRYLAAPLGPLRSRPHLTSRQGSPSYSQGDFGCTLSPLSSRAVVTKELERVLEIEATASGKIGQAHQWLLRGQSCGGRVNDLRFRAPTFRAT